MSEITFAPGQLLPLVRIQKLPLRGGLPDNGDRVTHLPKLPRPIKHSVPPEERKRKNMAKL